MFKSVMQSTRKNKEGAAKLQFGTKLAVGLFLLSFFAACSTGGQTMQKPPVPVLVGEVKREDVPVYLQAIGKLTADATVDVKAKKSGTLKEAPVPEGSYVKKGELLFRFGAGSAVDRLEIALANLLKDEANLEFVKKKLERYLSIGNKEFVTQLTLDELQKDVAAYEAQIKADAAEVRLARSDVADSKIYAKISGILGEKKVGVNNSVEKGDLLATIVQMDKVTVDFYLPEKFLEQVLVAVQKTPDLDIEVETQEEQKGSGKLTFMEPGVNPVTGTIMLRGVIDNEDRRLQPGQYVDVRLKLKELSNATLLPSAAVQIGQQGHYIYILKPDDTVELKIVHPIYNTENEIVVSEELPAGTKVVTDGQINLVPGAKVMIQNNASKATEPKLSDAAESNLSEVTEVNTTGPNATESNLTNTNEEK